MPGESSSAVEWSTRLEPARRAELIVQRADDPRLAEVIECWRGDPRALTPGRAVLIGFPQDAGVRRNHGRPGAAQAPREIRHHLQRLTPWDGDHGVDLAANPPLDLGDVRAGDDLEASQRALGEVVGAVLASGAVPIVLGGGHETAYGHYLGYVAARLPVGVVNLDAHLDVRPWSPGHGHSGSPFRQALEHPEQPLPGNRYVCLGAHSHAVSREHLRYLYEKGGAVRWCREVRSSLEHQLVEQIGRLGESVYLSVDADVVAAADVPGVSAPNVNGLAGSELLAAVRRAGGSLPVSSLDLVEINPLFDPDGRSSRWGALLVWQFLAGLATRKRGE